MRDNVMILEELSSVIYVAEFPLVCVYIYNASRRLFAVKGSRARYVASTWAMASAAGVVILLLIKAGVDAMAQDYASAFVSGFIAAVWIWWAIKGLLDDDNWFNDQWKRLKRGFKNLQQRLANISPLPSPA